MRGPYSDYAAPPIYVYPDRPKPGVRFSRTELVQLGVAILALSAALTIVYTLYSSILRLEAVYLRIPLLFGAAFVAVATGIGIHEIMHKIIAQRYGHWAEFRYSLRGLALTLMVSFFGFIFGAPGATWISGMVTREQNGRISAAGPVTNLVLGSVFLGGTVLVSGLPYSVPVLFLYVVLQQAAMINIILAGFNMIPILPLDGAKVWAWNRPAYVAIVAVVITILVAGNVTGFMVL